MEGREISQIVVDYITSVSGTHKQKLEHLVMANEAITKEYTLIEEQIQDLKNDSNTLNQDIDAFINTFHIIDEVEEDVKKTEQNIELINAMIAKLGKKVEQLKKNRKK